MMGFLHLCHISLRSLKVVQQKRRLVISVIVPVKYPKSLMTHSFELIQLVKGRSHSIVNQNLNLSDDTNSVVFFILSRITLAVNPNLNSSNYYCLEYNCYKP